ncbi:unnamed protein product [Parajaminaea phylloscopi]
MARQRTPTSSSSPDSSDLMITPTHIASYRPKHGQRTVTGPADFSHRLRGLDLGFHFSQGGETVTAHESAQDTLKTSALGSPRPRHAEATATPHPLNLFALGPFTPSIADRRQRNVSAPWQTYPFLSSCDDGDGDHKGSNASLGDVSLLETGTEPDDRGARVLREQLLSSPRSHGAHTESYFEDLNSHDSTGVRAKATVPSTMPRASTPHGPHLTPSSLLELSVPHPDDSTVSSTGTGTPSRIGSWSTGPHSATDSWPPSACSESGPRPHDATTHYEQENSLLRAQLTAFETQNAELSRRCENLAQEVGSLRLTLTRASIDGANISSPHLRRLAHTQTPQPMTQPLHKVRCTPATASRVFGSDVGDTSPSLGYLGPSLYETIQTHGQHFEAVPVPWAGGISPVNSPLPQAPQGWEPGHGHGRPAISHSYASGGGRSPRTPLHNSHSMTTTHENELLNSGVEASPRGSTSLPVDLSHYAYGPLPTRRQQVMGSVVASSPLPYLARHGSEPPQSTMDFSPARVPPSSPDVLIAKALTGRSQEASIVLQQQLKMASSEVRANIITTMLPHLLTLCEDKHGNFLVQRAIGVDLKVAWRLKGSFAHLAASQYGCHVVQRVLDEGEALKQQVVEELLEGDLMSTLTSRNAVHVWAKILEIQWSDGAYRRKVFERIHRAMKGHWAAVAMQETGSIVVQNLFESADEDDNGDCVDELLEHLPECAANQWGVWVVQHIIEHGSPRSKTAAFERLLQEAPRLSVSQYGQKAIMTALKSRNATFIARYLNQLCDSAVGSVKSGRRSMLVDVASTPQGLQIVTQLLTTIGREDRERMIQAVRKNSVFLKGSKTGLKVHQMCERARAYSGY